MSTSSSPSNAPTIAHILSTIDRDPGTILTKDQQTRFLEDVTSMYECPYYSSTFGSTMHNDISLRKALTSIMSTHIRPGVDIRPGKSAVDELFERGSEMLDEEYVKSVKEAAQGKGLRKQSVTSVDSCSDAEHEEDWAVRRWEEPSSGSDEDYQPTKKRTRATIRNRTPVKRLKVGHDVLPSPPAPPRKPVRPLLSMMKTGSSVDRSISPLDPKRTPISVKSDSSRTNADCEDTDSSDGEDVECCGSSGTQREARNDRAEELLRKLSKAWDRPALPRPQPFRAECRDIKASNPDDKPTSADELNGQIAHLKEAIKQAAGRYLSSIAESQSADLVVRPTPELKDLYAQVFGTPDWKATAAALQANHRLASIDLLRSVIAAFIFKKILVGDGSVPWLAGDAVPVFLAFKDTLLNGVNVHLESEVQRAIAKASGKLLEDSTLKQVVVKPCVTKLSSECMMALNGHLNMLGRQGVNVEARMRLNEDMEEVCRLALVLQSRLVMGVGSHAWTWFASGDSVDEGPMRAEGCVKTGAKLELTVFPRVVWNDGEGGGSVPAIISLM